jgi:membrane protein
MNALAQKLRNLLWDPKFTAGYPQYLVRAARFTFVLSRDLLEGQLTMRAMSLVYTSLLSLVPLLAIGFSFAKGLGRTDALAQLLHEFFRPLGANADELTDKIIGFVEKVQVGVLGSLGIALLFYAAVSMIHKVEESFNFIWRIERPRILSQRFGEYLGVLTVGPLLIVPAIGVTTAIRSNHVIAHLAAIEPFGMLVFVITTLLPYALIVGAFTFLYSFVPNTRVTLRAAASGGLFAGLLWQWGSLIFASFVGAATNYNLIYSGFAIVIFLLIWLYVGWMILLIGCQLAFYVQHPEHLKPHRVPPLLSGKEMEYLALMVMGLAGKRFIAGDKGYTPEELALALHAPPEHVARVIESLVFHGLLTEAGADRSRVIPGMDLEAIALARLWRLARAGNEPMPPGTDELSREAVKLLDEAESAFERHTGGMTLREWLSREPKTKQD